MCGSWPGCCLRDRAGPGMGWGKAPANKDALRQRFYARWRNFNNAVEVLERMEDVRGLAGLLSMG